MYGMPSFFVASFDVIFSVSSVLLCIFLGAALGNVVRGVPLRPDQYFFEPLWTNFRVGTDNGILDWYTLSVATFTTALMEKDIDLALDAAEDAGVQLPVTQEMKGLLRDAIDAGYGDDDFLALFQHLRSASRHPDQEVVR